MYQIQLWYINTFFNKLSIIVAVICLMYIIITIALMGFRILFRSKSDILSNNDLKEYKLIHSIFRMDGLGQRAALFVWLSRKILYSIFLVQVFINPLNQIICLLVTYAVYWIYLCIFRPI